jgi:hypothetical protein
VLRQRGELPPERLAFLLQGADAPNAEQEPLENPLADWLPAPAWAALCALRSLNGFASLPDDVVSSAKRWREWIEAPRPEDDPLPGEASAAAVASQPS